MEQLPKELIASILHMATRNKPKQVLQYALVCRMWHSAVLQDDVAWGARAARELHAGPDDKPSDLSWFQYIMLDGTLPLLYATWEWELLTRCNIKSWHSLE